MELVCFNKTKIKIWKSYYSRFEQIVKRTCYCLSHDENIQVSVVLVKDAKIQDINAKYRNKDQVTDVISFALCDWDEVFPTPQIQKELGDIFINVDAVIRQAKEYGHSEEREICFLFTHGLLHLFGYDHMNSEDEQEMTQKQKEILDEIVERVV